MQWNLKMSTFISFDCPIKKISELNSKMTIRYCSLQWEICLNISSLQDHWSQWSPNCQKCNFCELTVPPVSLTCSFILKRQTSCRELLKKNEKKLAWSFNFTFRYKDDVLSLNNWLEIVMCSIFTWKNYDLYGQC